MVDCVHAGQSQGCWSHVGRCRSNSRVRGDTLMTPDLTDFQGTALGRVEPELELNLPGKALSRDSRRRFRFVDHAAGCPHSMVLHGGCLLLSS